MKLLAKSLRRINNGAKNTNREIGLLVELNFQLFGMVTAYKMMELKQNLSLASYLSARKKYCKEREDIFKLAEFMAFLTASYCLITRAFQRKRPS